MRPAWADRMCLRGHPQPDLQRKNRIAQLNWFAYHGGVDYMTMSGEM